MDFRLPQELRIHRDLKDKDKLVKILKLRSCLEMMNDMSLARLKQILRAHFKEKSGTEVYQELASLCQGPKDRSQHKSS